MGKLPCKRTLLLLVFLSPCIATPQYIPRHRVDTPMRVARAGAIPYHDYAQPHSPSPQQQQQQQLTPHQHPRQFHPHMPVNNPNVIAPTNVNPNFNANAFSSRKGPFDSFIDRAKTWLPGSTGEMNSEPKMRDAHRLPNPPKYPLYDLPTIGMATPPPAPLMHPMAQIPTGNYNYEESSPAAQGGPWSNLNNDLAGSSSNHVANHRSPAHHGHHGHGPGGHNRKKPLRGPRPKHPLRGLGTNPFRPNNKKRLNNHNGPEGRGPPPNRRQHGHHQRQRPRGPPVQNRPNRLRAPPQKEEGFEHPMASNINPVNSPSLGRPLDYDEYMKRPSHSFTDDPWNFDPFASQMNQGMNTYALKYNYDPLGMNNLDNKANSHLDPAKLSYPGDFYNREATDSSGSSQIGGWDRAPTGYNGYMNGNSNQPPSAPAYDTTLTNPLEGGRIGPLDPFSSGTDNINSFNLFQQGNNNNNGHNGHNGNPQLGPTATVDLEQLNPPAEDAKIEFTIDTSIDPQQQQNGNLNENSKNDNMAGLSDNYNPYSADQPEGEPIGPPFGNLGDSNQDALQPPASFSYSRTSDYGMRNRRNNMCQYGNPNCIRRQLKRNLIIPTNAPNMLYNQNVTPLQESPSILQQQQYSHPQMRQQMHQQNLIMTQRPQMRQMNHYYPTAREIQQFRRQLNLRQLNYLNHINNINNNNLARSDNNNAIIVMEGGGGSLSQPQNYPQQKQGGHGHNNNNIVPRSDMPEGLQIFNELMKPNGNSNLLTHSAKADARNNLLKVLTQRK